jgi:hypothetical protein
MLTKNLLLAVIPCAGFGTRVSDFVPKGFYKEMGCVGSSQPNVCAHIEGLANSVKADIIAVVIANSKTLLQGAVANKLFSLGFVHDHTRIIGTGDSKRSDVNRSLREELYKRDTDGGVQYATVVISHDDLHKTQNPIDAVRLVYDISSSLLFKMHPNHATWDTLVMFPDIHYTDLDKVMYAIKRHQYTHKGNLGMASLSASSVPTLNPASFGRHNREDYVFNEKNYTHIVDVQHSTLEYESTPSYLETGILYLPYLVLFSPHIPKGSWIYDLMIGEGDFAIRPIDIDGTGIVDLGSPETYKNKENKIYWSII